MKEAELKIKALEELGFKKTENRYFTHPKTELFIEFPPPPISIGDEIIKKWAKFRSKLGTIELFTPTQSVMDRLAAFYHWNDRQALKQALMVAKKHKIGLKKIKHWSISESMENKFIEFKNML